MGCNAAAGRLAERLLRFAIALSVIAGVTTFYSLLIPANGTTVALSLLLSVLGISAKWALPEAVVASLAAVLCFNRFFLPPLGTWTIEDPQNWVALGAFLVTSVVGSQLSAGIRRRATEAIQRQKEIERLYALSRAMMLADSLQDVGRQVAHLIAQILEAEGVALYDRAKNRFYRAGHIEIEDHTLRDVAIRNTPLTDPMPKTLVGSIGVGGPASGSLALSGISVSNTALRSIGYLAAIVLERAQSLEAASRADAARQSEELKSTLLDALAHEFKTPLTSIKAASTALLSDPALNPTHQELLQVIDEETDRLNSMVTEALQTARLEAGRVRISPVVTSIPDLVQHGMARLGAALQEHVVEIQIPGDLPAVYVDHDLILIVLVHLLDNAVKYSPAGTPIRVSAGSRDGRVEIRVSDGGPGIDILDRERIFERFYRAEATKHLVRGSGMGLAIAREIVQLHGGLIWAENRPGGGAAFSLCLPVSEAEVAR